MPEQKATQVLPDTVSDSGNGSLTASIVQPPRVKSQFPLVRLQAKEIRRLEERFGVAKDFRCLERKYSSVKFHDTGLVITAGGTFGNSM